MTDTAAESTDMLAKRLARIQNSHPRPGAASAGLRRSLLHR